MSSKISFVGIFGTKKQPPPPRLRKVHFAKYTWCHGYYDTELGKWMDLGWHLTVRRAQFPAGVLYSRRKNDDCD